MYMLVEDIDAYPQFLPWCQSVNLLEKDQDQVTATLNIQHGLLRVSFTTCNTMTPYEKIDMRLTKGPFRHLHGQWEFTALGDQACKVALTMSFEFSSVVGVLARPAFSTIANTMVDAFCQRAKAVYG